MEALGRATAADLVVIVRTGHAQGTHRAASRKTPSCKGGRKSLALQGVAGAVITPMALEMLPIDRCERDPRSLVRTDELEVNDLEHVPGPVIHLHGHCAARARRPTASRGPRSRSPAPGAADAQSRTGSARSRPAVPASRSAARRRRAAVESASAIASALKVTAYASWRAKPCSMRRTSARRSRLESSLTSRHFTQIHAKFH